MQNEWSTGWLAGWHNRPTPRTMGTGIRNYPRLIPSILHFPLAAPTTPNTLTEWHCIGGTLGHIFFIYFFLFPFFLLYSSTRHRCISIALYVKLYIRTTYVCLSTVAATVVGGRAAKNKTKHNGLAFNISYATPFLSYSQTWIDRMECLFPLHRLDLYLISFKNKCQHYHKYHKFRYISAIHSNEK